MYATLAQLKTTLGISDASKDATLTSCLQQASILMSAYIGADLSSTDEREDTGTLEAGKNFYHLPVFPLIDVTYVELDSVAVDPGDYTFSAKSGKLEFPFEGDEDQAILVDYTAGFATVPDDLNLVCQNLAAAIYNAGGTLASQTSGTGSLKSLTMFDAMSMSFDTGAGAASSNSPSSMLSAWAFILDAYKLKGPVLK